MQGFKEDAVKRVTNGCVSSGMRAQISVMYICARVHVIMQSVHLCIGG